MEMLKKEIQEELTDHILPFWIGLKDGKYGGFYGWVNYELKADPKAVKGGIAAARLLWSFSAAYRVLKDEVCLEQAHHAYEFLAHKIIDAEHRGMYWMVDAKGKPKDPSKHIYAQSFGIYALSEYYKVTKKEEALDLAKELYQLIETKGFDKENSAYKEQFDRHWREKPNKLLSGNGIVAEITTNTHLHVLEAYTNLYRVWPDQQLKERLTNLVYLFKEKIFDPESKFLRVFFDQQWNSLMDIQSYGHDIEASWLIDDALKVLGLQDSDLIKMVVDIAYNIAEQGMQEDGSLINEKENARIDYSRVWWVQAEAMVGFLNAYDRTQDPKFIELVKGLWGYTKKYMIDQRKNGEWYWAVDSKGNPMKREIAGPWKAPYHNSRSCMEIIERLTN